LQMQKDIGILFSSVSSKFRRSILH